MEITLIQDEGGSWQVWDERNEWCLGVIQETELGPYFLPCQTKDLICWTPEALRKISYLLDGLKLAKMGVDFPDNVPYCAN